MQDISVVLSLCASEYRAVPYQKREPCNGKKEKQGSEGYWRRAREAGEGRDPRPLDADQFRNITIHDRWGSDKDRPRASIVGGHYSYRTIDIYRSVENNAASICHPVIRRAIEKWDRDARGRNLAPARSIAGREGRELAGNAERHLKCLCEALLTGVRKRTTSRQTAFVIQENSQQLHEEYEYLKTAWEFIGEAQAKDIIRRHGLNLAKLLPLIEERLAVHSKSKVTNYRERLESEGRTQSDLVEIQEHWAMFMVERMMAYLKSEMGEAFLGRQKSRKSWRDTKNNYLAWRFELEKPEVAASYRYKAKARNDSPDFSPHQVGKDNYFFPSPMDAQNLPLIDVEEI